MSDASWDDLRLTERAIQAALALGWKKPTPIQAAVVPHLSVGRDVIGRAETGSGKTGAYGLVLTDSVKAPDGVQVLVLAPTRELVQQIAKDLNALAVGAPFLAIPVYGGVPYDPQIAALRTPEATCCVATTGRLLDLLAKKQVDLSKVRIVVIDEADRMLDLGFLPEVERVLKMIPGSRQTALFTATMPKKVATLAHQYMAHPRDLEVGRTTPETAEHYRLDVASQDKLATLLAVLEAEKPARAIVFTRTRDGAQDLARHLATAGVRALALHGDLTQPQREGALASLKDGTTKIVVATDVAGRGLDISELTHVINYDIPEEGEQYVHRAGRTARAGKRGRVLTLVTENDGLFARACEEAAKTSLIKYGIAGLTRDQPLPPPKEKPGGNARGARKRNKNPAPTQSHAPKPEVDVDARVEREFTLPPSRRKRDDAQ